MLKVPAQLLPMLLDDVRGSVLLNFMNLLADVQESLAGTQDALMLTICP